MNRTLVSSLALGVLLVGGVYQSAQAQVVGRANNANPFNQNSAWTGGVAPTSAQVAGFSSINSTSSATSTIDTGVNFQIAGITYTSNPATNLTIAGGGAGSLLTLGSSGIDLSLGGRNLSITSNVALGANQTWTTGTAGTTAAPVSQLTVSGTISGSGSVTIAGVSGSPYSAVYLNGSHTFSGGVVLNSGGAVRLGGTATFSGSLPTASAIGTGNLTINGGTIFGGGATIAPVAIAVNSDFGLNLGLSGLNGRLTIGGGTVDLGNATRTVSLGRYQTAVLSLTSGNQSLQLNPSTGAPPLSVTNGNLRLIRETISTNTAADYVSVNFGATGFTAGTGLTIGDHVITTISTGNPFGTTAGAQPHVTVESGGYFNMSDATAARSPNIRSLSGAGTVTSLANSVASGTSTLTINSQSGDDYTFSGAIVTGSSLNGALGTSAANVTVAVTKQGLGIQRFSGSNTYAGATTVSAGTLILSSGGSLDSSSAVTVASGAQIGGDGTINGNLTLANGARFVFDLNNNPLTVGGTLAFNSSFGVNSLVQANGSAVDWTTVGLGTYKLIGTSFVFSSANITNFGLANAAVLGGGKSAYFENGSLDLVVIPEPGTCLLVGLGLASVTILRRRSRK